MTINDHDGDTFKIFWRKTTSGDGRARSCRGTPLDTTAPGWWGDKTRGKHNQVKLSKNKPNLSKTNGRQRQVEDKDKDNHIDNVKDKKLWLTTVINQLAISKSETGSKVPRPVPWCWRFIATPMWWHPYSNWSQLSPAWTTVGWSTSKLQLSLTFKLGRWTRRGFRLGYCWNHRKKTPPICKIRSLSPLHMRHFSNTAK